MPIEIRLKRGEERRVLSGHLWIFSNEIAGTDGKTDDFLAHVLTASGNFLGTAFYNPKSLIACRILSKERLGSLGPEFFLARLSAALARRERTAPGRKFCRLCFGESDALPGLVVDRYDSVLVLQILSAGMEFHLGSIARALEELLKPSGLYLKNDHRNRSLEGLLLGSRVFSGEVPERLVVEEGGLKLPTPIQGAQKTGFYFDQSENRSFLKPYFYGRNVLDLYCYTGAFTLAALRSGARAALGIDSSETALFFAREAARTNAISPQVSFEKNDAEKVLSALLEKRFPFSPDLILLDPPNLCPSKKDLPKALKAYIRLNEAALRALPEGGLLASSSCSHHVTRELFLSLLKEAAGRARKNAKLLSLRGQALDHPILLSMPETEYLHFALIEA